MAKLLNEESFIPSRLPGLSLWMDAQATSTISSSTTGGVTSWADRSGSGNNLNTSTFFVPGCTLWFDASDPNATGVPAANGATISTWKDKSGLGSNATATGTPTIKSTGLNGKPTMNFNGSSWFTGLTTNTGTTSTIFMVMQQPQYNTTTINTPYTRVLSMAPLGGSDDNNAGVYTKSLLIELVYGSVLGWRSDNSSFIQPVDTPYIMDYELDGTQGTSYLNGTAQAAFPSTDTFNIGSYRIGGIVQYGGTPQYTGYVSEVLVFTTALTSFQRTQVETYLSRKWGVPLSYSIPNTPLLFSPFYSPVPIVSNTSIITQPSIFFPPGAQMISTLNSGLGAPSVPGCVLWLDAADTSTIKKSGTSVTQWNDKSGSGFVATPIDSTVVTTTLNGLNILEFSNNRMIIPNFTWNMSFTSIMVWKASSGTQMIGLCASTATNATWYDYIFTGNWSLVVLNNATASSDPNYIQGPTDPFPGSPGNVAPVNQWFIFSIGYTAGTTTITNYALNGTARISSAVFPQTGTNTGVYFINGLANSAYGNSQIAEIMHFNRSVTSDERQSLEGYLATKWGLRTLLPTTHPYSSVPYTAPFTLNPSTPVSKSIFIAYQTPSLTSTMRFAIGNDVSGGAFGFSQTQYYNSAPYQYGYGDTRWPVDQTTYALPTVLSAIYDASAGIIRGDHSFNTAADVRESAMMNIISNTPYSLGTSPISSSIVLSASFHICEIIAYNRALATTDRQMIEGYLAWKWGIVGQLPTGHPYKQFRPSGEQVIIPSTPLNLMQGLVSWLDMADTSSYTLSGTTLKTLNDKATTNGTFTQTGKPNNFFLSNIGSLPALVFPGNNTSTIGSNTFLYRSLSVPSQGSACMVLIPKSQFTASKLGVIGWGSPNPNATASIGLGYNSPTTTVQTLQSYNTGTNTFFGPSLNLTVDTPMILFWAWYNGNMVYFSCNGTNLLTSAQGTTTYYNPPTTTDNLFYIGNDGGFGAQFTLGELVMYNQYAETPFRNLIEGYLAWKWGIQSNLPAYHPYYYSAPGLQSLTEVNALSEPSDISGLTMWLDAADTTTLTLTPSFIWIDKSAVANHVMSTTTGNFPSLSNYGTSRRPSVYFGPGSSAKSTYNSGASSGQFSAFIVASVPTLSYLLISTGQFTTATSAAGANGQTFAFYASNGSTFGVCSPFVSPGGTNVGPYSTVCGATVELFASVSGLTTLGNLNFGSTVAGTCATIPGTPWVFGDCSGDPTPKSFHVHEFITYSRQLATNERWTVEGYLYWKWMHLI